MDIVVSLISANDLKNVNWRHGILQAYAVVWIDSSSKYSTKADLENGVNPAWDEKLPITVPSTSDPKTATLYIDIVHADGTPDTKPLIGSAKLPLSVILNEAQAKGKAMFNLNLERPSGRPQGTLKIKIKVKEYSNMEEPYKQQVQPQPYYQPPYQMGQQAPMNQCYPDMPSPYIQGHSQYLPQAVRPKFGWLRGKGSKDMRSSSSASDAASVAAVMAASVAEACYSLI